MRRQELHPRTEALNKTQKNKSKKARNEALNWLAKNFPQAFDNTLKIRPLKIGIIEDIFLHLDQATEAGISKSKLREAVVLFTRRVDYLACLKAREMRIDLEGASTNPVTEEEAERASTKIKKRIEKSARNARKLINKSLNQPSTKPSSPYTPNHSHPSSNSHSHSYSQENNLYDSDRPRTYNSTSASISSPRTPVMVRHKTSRTFDPSAVARLKEKLGLSKKVKKETDERELVD